MNDGETQYRGARLPGELNAAVDSYCARHDISFSTLARRALANEIGRPDLGHDPKVGRPPKPNVIARGRRGS